jgi:hypothetical protein
MALAFVHHLAIGKNIPFSKMAEMFAGLGKWLLIEFVPKDDEKVALLLQHKKDIYSGYSEQAFVQEFSGLFRVVKKHTIASTSRILFLMERL